MKKLFFALALALCYTGLYAQFTAADFQMTSFQVLHVTVTYTANCTNPPLSQHATLRTQQRNRWIGGRMDFDANTASFFDSDGRAVFQAKKFTVANNKLTVNGLEYQIQARPRTEYHSLVITEGCMQTQLIIAKRPGRKDIKGLRLYYHNNLRDNFTMVTSGSEDRAMAANYTYVRVEGRILNREEGSSTAPLFLYHSAERNDYVLCAHETTIKDVKAANYQWIRPVFIGDDGFVYKTQVAGTVPLKLFYHDGRADHMTTATADGEADALGAGYRFVRIEGYVFP
jgi:hypothetical protein